MYCLIRYDDSVMKSIYCPGVNILSIKNLSSFQIVKLVPEGTNRFNSTPLTQQLIRFQRLARWYLKTIHKFNHPRTWALREQGHLLQQLIPRNPETQVPGIGGLFLQRRLCSRRNRMMAAQHLSTNEDSV